MYRSDLEVFLHQPHRQLRKLKLLPVELGFGKKRSVGGWPAPDAHSGILERLAEMSLPYGTKIEIGSDGTGTVLL